MVLAGVGIDHQRLVDLGNKFFSVPTNGNKATNEVKAVWTGGAVMVRRRAAMYFHAEFPPLGRTRSQPSVLWR